MNARSADDASAGVGKELEDDPALAREAVDMAVAVGQPALNRC